MRKTDYDPEKEEFPSFFGQLTKEEVKSISKDAILYEGGKGELLFPEGSKADSLYVIKRGNIKLATYDKDGRELIIGVFSSGEAIWESVFLDKNASFPYNAILMDQTIVIRLWRDVFEEATKDSDLSLRMIGLLSKKLHDANERNLIISIQDPLAKLARFFLYRLNHSDTEIISMKLEDIAAHVSLRPETVSRKIGLLMDMKAIEKVGQSSYEIKNHSLLVDIAES